MRGQRGQIDHDLDMPDCDRSSDRSRLSLAPAARACAVELGETMSETCLCALGKTAANPVMSTLRYFRNEYEAHIREGTCPAAVCRELILYAIDSDRCTGCGACLRACPNGAITGQKKQPHLIDPDICTKCGICRETCQFEAVTVR